MKTEIGISQTWDDLVFENKNKEYGAYLVRKSYSKNITTGLGLSVIVAALLILLPQVLSIFSAGKIIAPKIIACDFGQIEFKEIPPFAGKRIPVKPKPPVQSSNQNLPPHVTTKPVAFVPPADESALEDPVTDSQGEVSGPSDVGSISASIIEVPVVDPNKVWDAVEVMPQYDGGINEMMKFIQRRMRYPAIAVRNGIEGTVFVSFVINSLGKIVDVSLVKGISRECDKEAVRVISMMNAWKAGFQNHQAVSVRMTLPIKFQLAE